MPYLALNICGYEDSLFSSVIMDYRELFQICQSLFSFYAMSALWHF